MLKEVKRWLALPRCGYTYVKKERTVHFVAPLTSPFALSVAATAPVRDVDFHPLFLCSIARMSISNIKYEV
jgi:hypothetical protein